MSKRVLLVGCGEIGSRHLQAVATIPGVSRIDVVDGRREGLQLGQTRVAEVAERQRGIEFRWLSSLEQAGREGDLCIIATQADVRPQVVRQVADSFKFENFILEKLVTRSVSEYEELMKLADAKGLSIWVNCKTRAHPSHVRAKSHLDSSEPIAFNIIGGNHGLVTNGIHMVDLFVFYDDAIRITPVGSCIDPVLHRTKRGAFDLSGSLYGRSDKGSDFSLCFAGTHSGPLQLSLSSPHYRALIDDMTQSYYESTPETDWAWRPVPFSANMTISNMTRFFAAEILQRKQCQLPTLKGAFAAHQFILGELQDHFARLMGSDLDYCPST